MNSPELSMVPKGRLSLSPTKNTDLSCPFRFNAVHNEDVAEPEVYGLVMGSLVHLVAASYCEHLHRGGLQTDFEGLDRIARAEWENRPASIPIDARGEYLQLVEGLRGFFFDNPEDVAGVELRLAFDDDWNEVAWGSEDCAFGGIVDIMQKHQDQTATIWDWTSASLRGAFGVSKDYQVRFYGVLIRAKYGITEILGRVKSLRTGTLLEIEMDKEVLDETEREMRSERARMLALHEAGIWTAIPGKACAYCRLKCPELAVEAEKGLPIRVDNQEEAERLLRRVTVMKSRQDKIVETLKAYCELHGVIRTNGMQAGFFASEEKHVPISEDLKELLDNNGIAIADVVKYTQSLLTKHEGYKSLTRPDRKALKEVIDDMTEKKQKERWAVKRDDGRE